MKKYRFISILFYFSGTYDGILGLTAFFAPGLLFNIFNVTPPNHFGYIQFPAALLFVFGIMFFIIAANPGKNYRLIPYGIGLKFSYSIVVFMYWFTSGLPDMWKPFAVIDIILGILFIIFYYNLKREARKKR